MPQDWFAQNAPGSAQNPVTARISSGDDDWFSANSPTAFGDQIARDAGVRAQIDELPGNPLGRFVGAAASHFNPITIAKGLVGAVVPEALGGTGPINTVLAAARAGGQQIAKGFDAYDEGRYMEAGAHTLAGFLPLVGPAAVGIGERIGSGDIAGGLGDATGFVGSMLAPAALARKIPARGAAKASGLNPVERAAVEAGQAAGVPIDAATATGNRFVGHAQHIADRSLGGAGIAQRAQQAQANSLATMGEQLAAKGYGSPVSYEQAGAGVQSSVLGQVKRHHGDANAAYAKLREIEALEENAMTVAPKLTGTAAAEGALPAARGPRGVQRFAKQGESTEGLFQGVLGDARRNGFTGSADELRTEFIDRLASAKSLGIESATSEGSNAALLMEIRRLGGIKPWVNDYQQGAKAGKFTEEFKNISDAFEHNHGMRGGGGVMRRDGGLEYDDLYTQLRQEGKWSEIPDAETLMERVYDIARDPKSLDSVKHDLETLLNQTGVKPGEKWWSTGSGEKVVQLPVALGEAKAALEPLYQELKWQADNTPAAMMGDKARAYNALAKLLNADDFVSLSRIDAVLGDLKSFARTDVPELATAGQGAVKQAIAQLDAAVLQAAKIAGPEAEAALRAGRKSTIAKYEAADVLDKLKAEPVRTVKGLTASQDVAIAQLRELAKQAPAEIPKLGRAFLDDLIETARVDGGFNKAQTIATKWQGLGKETKLLLYKDPGYIKDLDNFFRLAEMMTRNANASGSAGAIAAGGQGVALYQSLATLNPMPIVSSVAGGAAVSKFLHSAVGVRLLTKGFKIPKGNTAAIRKYRAELAAFAQKLGTTNPSERQPSTAGAMR